MTNPQLRCDDCAEVFEDIRAYTRHQEEAHGAVTSLAEQEMGDVRDQLDEGPGTPSQADRLVGDGDVEHNHGETEHHDPDEREVHRPPTPGRSRL